ncbi:MAG: Xaa-Pro peptidase family protein [Phycisphaerales bacterium]
MARKGTSPSAAAPYRRRITALRRACSRAKVDALLVTDPTDVGYLTGFLGGDSYLILTPSGKPVLISDNRYEEDLKPFGSLVDVRMRVGTILSEVGATLADAGLFSGRGKTKLGVQGEHMTLAQHVALRSAMGEHKLPASAVTTTKGLVSDLRVKKDDSEVALIRKAIQIQQQALKATLEIVEPGLSEFEICAELEYQMKSRGSTEPAFHPIVGAKANSSRPHYEPAKAKTANNNLLLIDWGATWKGYRSDMTRTFAIGTWPTKMAEVYDIVLEAHQAAAAALKPGSLCKSIDAVARDVITNAGFGDKFGHGLGHGLGMHVHEEPRLSKLAGDQRLEPGHVVTIEPGIYLPGIGGVRIEDDYLITNTGARNLCTLPKTRRWSTL